MEEIGMIIVMAIAMTSIIVPVSLIAILKTTPNGSLHK